MDKIEEVKKVLRVLVGNTIQRAGNEDKIKEIPPLMYLASKQICQLFETKADESRLLLFEEREQYWEENRHCAGWQTWKMLKAQDTKTASILEQKCQDRVDRIFREIDNLFKWTETHYSPDGNVGTPDSTGGVVNIGTEYVLMNKDKYKALKKQEGVDG